MAIDLSSYMGKRDHVDKLPADSWNALMQLLQDSINESAPTAPSSHFLVNGAPAAVLGGVVTLAAGGTYILEGELQGRIVIGEASDEPLDDTFITLNGVHIVNDATDRGISYEPNAQSLVVNLPANKSNFIRCTHVAEMAEQQGAALYSENNMVVQGCGYLSVTNKGGHGIKASELRFHGSTHIYAEAIHDGIHGNSVLSCIGGVYYVNGANDAFGTGTDGHIVLVKGKYRCANIRQQAFDSKQPGISLSADIDAGKSSISGLQDIADQVQPDNAAAIFGAPTVTVNGSPIPAPETQNGVFGTYELGSAEGDVIVISGYIKQQININATKADITLDSAYLAAPIRYTLGSSNMQINTVKDSFNIIHISGAKEFAIDSANNVKLEAKGGSYLVLSGTHACIGASEVTIHDSKGAIVMINGQYGIRGTDIYIADSADHKAFADECFGGLLMGFGSAGIIHARLSGKGKKANVTVKNENLTGVVVMDKIEAESGSTDTTGINIGGSKNVYVKHVSGDVVVGAPLPYSEPYEVIPYGKFNLPI